jgi:hypothetical protein
MDEHDSSWKPIEEFPFIAGWQCDRSRTINLNGVADVITLHLQDARNGETLMVVMLPETAHRMGWDMIGEAGDFFAHPEKTT